MMNYMPNPEDMLKQTDRESLIALLVAIAREFPIIDIQLKEILLKTIEENNDGK
jgi:hypothetical protein